MLELTCTTQVLLDEIHNPRLRQKDIATTYRLAILSSDETDWKEVNKAIITRWSKSGLERIKKMAWRTE